MTILLTFKTKNGDELIDLILEQEELIKDIDYFEPLDLKKGIIFNLIEFMIKPRKF